MKLRSVAMVGGWTLAVAVATAAGWAGVGLISNEVSPSGPRALSQAEVSGRIHATSTGTAGAAAADPSSAATTSAVDPSTSDTEAAPTGPSDPSEGTGPSGTTRTASTRTTPASATKRSYTTHGGTVVLTCDGDQITASTFPGNGYIVSKESRHQGTAISIEFKGANGESKLEGGCVQGTPTVTVGETGSGGD